LTVEIIGIIVPDAHENSSRTVGSNADVAHAGDNKLVWQENETDNKTTLHESVCLYKVK